MPLLTSNVSQSVMSLLDNGGKVVSNIRDINPLDLFENKQEINKSFDSPLQSSQQLKIDWSKFENHTFFSSAEAKFISAVDKIVNEYPFEGGRSDIEDFFSKLTGFEYWVYENFPKYRGGLRFDNFANSFVVIRDYSGSLFPVFSKNRKGDPIINPGSNSMTIESWVKFDLDLTGISTLFQKTIDSSCGFGCFVESISADEVKLTFYVSTPQQTTNITEIVKKNEWNHLTFILSKIDTTHSRLKIILNGVSETKGNVFNFGKIEPSHKEFLLGEGTPALIDSTTTISPSTSLGAVLDEFRIWHSERSSDQILKFMNREVFSTDDLVLYYKFNEPAGDLSPTPGGIINSIVLDSSGKSLHSVVTNFDPLLRVNMLGAEPMKKEKEFLSPVLFPSFSQTIDFVEEILTEAISYDKINPNLIIKLVPQHYFDDAQIQEGLENWLDADKEANFFGKDFVPREKIKESKQTIASFLYIWAKFFDEIKLYVDSFVDSQHVDWEVFGNSPNNFLLKILKEKGFDLIPFFNSISTSQLTNTGQSDFPYLDEDFSGSEIIIQEVQSELIKRVLLNLPDVLKSKGTQHSIKSFLRSVGIDPNESIKIKEYGGTQSGALDGLREDVIKTTKMVEINNPNYLIFSDYLTSDRLETEGSIPNHEGSFSGGVSTVPSDSLLMSGSWSIELLAKLTPTNNTQHLSQSLFRVCSSDSSGGHPGMAPGSPNLLSNVILIRDKETPRIAAYLRPGDDPGSPTLTLETNIPQSIVNGEKFKVLLSCRRNDQINSFVSSSYELCVSTTNAGELDFFTNANEFFYETPLGENNLFRDKVGDLENYISTGQNESFTAGFLNDPLFSGEYSETKLLGNVSNLRFWSRAITVEEFFEHSKNLNSVGVENPLKNWNYSVGEGSWERLRLETLHKQPTTETDPSGNIEFIDVSENGFITRGTGIEPEKKVFSNEVFDYSYLSPNIDEGVTDEKVRVRGYESIEFSGRSGHSITGLAYEIPRSESPLDDNRLSVEISLIDRLNNDIITIFSSYDIVSDMLGSPENLTQMNYDGFVNLRDLYFEKVKGNISNQSFFEFFRWFNKSVGDFIKQLVPRKTYFKGTNYVISSHFLERNKYQHVDTRELPVGDNMIKVL